MELLRVRQLLGRCVLLAADSRSECKKQGFSDDESFELTKIFFRQLTSEIVDAVATAAFTGEDIRDDQECPDPDRELGEDDSDLDDDDDSELE